MGLGKRRKAASPQKELPPFPERESSSSDDSIDIREEPDLPEIEPLSQEATLPATIALATAHPQILSGKAKRNARDAKRKEILTAVKKAEVEKLDIRTLVENTQLPEKDIRLAIENYVEKFPAKYPTFPQDKKGIEDLRDKQRAILKAHSEREKKRRNQNPNINLSLTQKSQKNRQDKRNEVEKLNIDRLAEDTDLQPTDIRRAMQYYVNAPFTKYSTFPTKDDKKGIEELRDKQIEVQKKDKERKKEERARKRAAEETISKPTSKKAKISKERNE